MEHPLLSRELLAAGGLDALIGREVPDFPLLTEAQRAASLRAVLNARPPGDVWLFGYGSLIWNPTIATLERRTARIDGWHRAFCLSASIGRGSPDNPGLVLGLDADGACTGVAFRIAEEVAEAELALLWRREMLSPAYQAQWLPLLDGRGDAFAHGIAFVIDPACQHYAGGLSEEDVVRRLATARGSLGSAADYLFQTCDGLRAHGIPDADMEDIARRVRAMQDALDCLPR